MTNASPEGCFISCEEYTEICNAIRKNQNSADDDIIIKDIGDDWHSDDGNSFSKPCGCGLGVIVIAEINANGDIFFAIEPNE